MRDGERRDRGETKAGRDRDRDRDKGTEPECLYCSSHYVYKVPFIIFLPTAVYVWPEFYTLLMYHPPPLPPFENYIYFSSSH